jgi:hypothetical protein
VSVGAVLVKPELFEPISVSEQVLEGLLRDGGSYLFPGHRYYDFRPPIPSVHGTRHPDGVLLSMETERWWVVEVESHAHDVSTHISPQLQGLSCGHYGPKTFSYLKRHDAFKAADYDHLDTWQPSFLLIIDHATAEIRAAANLFGFVVVECSTFFHAPTNHYALTVSGDRPRITPTVLPPGVDVALAETYGVVDIRPLYSTALPDSLPTMIRVGSLVVEANRRDDGSSIVLPLDLAQISGLIGDGSQFRLCFDGRLIIISSD